MAGCQGCSWGQLDFLRSIYVDAGILKQFYIDHNIIKEFVNCEKCGARCSIYVRSEGVWLYRCTKRVPDRDGERRKQVPCGFTRSVRNGTFLGESSLKPLKIAEFCASWLLVHNPRNNYLMQELHLAQETVTNWSSFCRQVCEDWVQENSHPIGGPGVIVEIDEAKFGKRKYNRGRRIEGQWVFGAVERDNPKKFFMIPVERRDEETLVRIIQDNILPGTVVVSDCWKAYSNLQNQAYQHLRVNHSIEFVDTTASGQLHQENVRRMPANPIPVHTQHIERKWRDVRYTIPVFGRRKTDFTGYLAEHLFKRNFERDELIHQFFVQAALSFPPP
mgnify:CR=1 FL=1